MRILLGLALVWLGAWSIAGYYMREAGSEKLAAAEHVAKPAARLERGAEVRVEGVVVGDSSATSPHRRVPCLAAVTWVFVTSSYQDVHNRPIREATHVATRRVGPASLAIEVADQRLELPIERWLPQQSTSEVMGELPERLGVTPEEIATAKRTARGSPSGFSVSESTIDGGARVFVVGRLEDRDGPLRLEPDPVLGRVELFPGSQEELVRELSGSGGGLRVAGWILGAGLGPLPLAIVVLVWLVRRKGRPAPSPSPPPSPTGPASFS